MPHLDIEFDKIVGISSEGGTHVERDFKPWPGKFFDNPKDIRKKFHLVSWVLDRLDINSVELLPPMIKLLLFGVPTGDRRISAAPFVVAPMIELILRQYRSACDLIVGSSRDFRNDVLPDGQKVFWR